MGVDVGFAVDEQYSDDFGVGAEGCAVRELESPFVFYVVVVGASYCPVKGG